LTKAAIFAVYISISLFGLYQLKVAEVGFNLQYVAGMTLYVLGFFLWLVVLRWFPLSIAFPLAAGTIIVGTQIVGAFLLKEQFDVVSLVAVSFILIGLTILGSIDAIRGAM
jgi:multidrug transporter EmrE-like cation transporter